MFGDQSKLVFFAIFVLNSPMLLASSIEEGEETGNGKRRNDDEISYRAISDLKFPSIYHAVGTIGIPSAKITEPFEAWHAGKYNRSRIDYYHGTVKTFQRADVGKYGTLYEIIPKYDYRRDSHYQGCWKKKGKQKKKIEAQNVLPKNVYWPFKMNLAQYKFQGIEELNGVRCTKWVAEINMLNRTDTYTFHASDDADPKPIRFEMEGYDILLTSYYDHYIVDYKEFSQWEYDPSVFDIPEVAKRDQWCRKVPKNIGEAGYRSINPIEEFLDKEEYENFEKKFSCFKKDFGKNYKHEKEHRKRMQIARHNMRFIHSMNRKQLGFKLDVNHFADLTDNEFKGHGGTLLEDQNETDEYERSIPVFDEHFEDALDETEDERKMEKQQKFESEDEESSRLEHGSSENMDSKSKEEGRYEDGMKAESGKSYNGDNGEIVVKKSGIEKEKVLNEQKSNTAENGLEKEMRDLVFFGEKLDELSEQIGRRSDGKIPKDSISLNEQGKIKESNKNVSVEERFNGTTGLSSKGVDEIALANFKAGNEEVKQILHLNEETSAHSSQSIVQKSGRAIGEAKRRHGGTVSESVKLKGMKSERKKSRKEKWGRIRRTGKRKMKGFGFNIDGKTLKVIDGEKLSESMTEESLAEFISNKNVYEPEVVVRDLQYGHSQPITTLREENVENGGRKSTLVKSSDDYEDFMKMWKAPVYEEVTPFFMTGFEEGERSEGNIDTMEYDFLVKDDSRFPSELRKRKRKKKLKKKGKPKRKTRIPVELDWRNYGALSPIQSQGICGSCWTFSTTAAVESANFIKSGKLTKLSEQQLLDCTWYVPHSKEGNHGCMGGWTWKSFAFIKEFGLATSKSYGNYLAMENSCNAKNFTVGANIDSFMKVAPNNAKALMKAIAMYGPATASINTEAKTLKFYKHGIYNDKLCNGATDHSVLVVGYGRENGKLYWIVRNSWGQRWGEDGYVKIENGRCGLLKKPWVIINRRRKQLPWLDTIKQSQLIEI